MNKAEKIKAEVERRLRTIEPNLPSREEFDKVADRNQGINSDFNIGEKMGAYTMLKKVEQFIDSLEQPIKRTPAEIEAAMQEVEEKSKLFTEAHKDDVVSNDTIDNLEEAAKNYEEDAIFYAARRISDFFKAGAQWQKERMLNNAIEREVKVDAGGYPYIDVTELYDYDKDKPLAKKGNKVKLIIIMEE